MNCNGIEYFYVYDLLGNVIALMDATGSIVVKYIYDAWGNHKVLNPNNSINTSATFIGNINPYRYRGYRYDVETNLYYLNARYYDPSIGRFISMDNSGVIFCRDASCLNLYVYVANNPIKYYDQSGMYREFSYAISANLEEYNLELYMIFVDFQFIEISSDNMSITIASLDFALARSYIKSNPLSSDKESIFYNSHIYGVFDFLKASGYLGTNGAMVGYAAADVGIGLSFHSIDVGVSYYFGIGYGIVFDNGMEVVIPGFHLKIKNENWKEHIKNIVFF